MYPQIFGDTSSGCTWGFVLAIAATVFVWWLLNRSTVGFELRAVGANPKAARTAGINVIHGPPSWSWLIAGALAGLAGVAQVAGTEKVLTDGVAASLRLRRHHRCAAGTFDAVGHLRCRPAVRRLPRRRRHRCRPTPAPRIDIVLVVQSLIVLFIAAPPLVRAVFRLNPRRRKPATAGNPRQAATTGGAA